MIGSVWCEFGRKTFVPEARQRKYSEYFGANLGEYFVSKMALQKCGAEFFSPSAGVNFLM